MLAMGLWRRRCALVSAAVLLVGPASAQDPVDPNPDTASAKTDEPTDSTGLESALGEPDSQKPDPEESESDFEEPDAADFEEALPMDALQQPSDIEAIPITGSEADRQKYLAALSAAGDLQALRIEDVSDLSNYTPNLEINTAVAVSKPTIFIRGLGMRDYDTATTGPVAVYQDGVNLNSPVLQLSQFFDIEGVDVLRGPQGSVNGHNATAGAIMIRSALPDGEFGVSTSLTYGNYDNKEVEAAINIPLFKDVLSMRVSGTAQWRDGYTKNQCAGWNPTALTNPATGEPFRRVDEETNTSLYWELAPAGQYEGGEIREVSITNGRRTQSDYVYLNYDKAVGNAGLEAASSYAQGIGGVNTNNPWTLDEDLVDENGDPVFFYDYSEGIMKQAVAGTPVTFQRNTLTISDVDDICLASVPGQVATLVGENSFYHAGDPEWQEGNWRASRVQPGLEDFADLNRWTNNIDNWAARMVLLFEPLDNMEWMFNAHGTQNRGDSAHFQMLGADTNQEKSGFFEDLQNGFSEKAAAVASGFVLGEGTRSVKGLVPQSNDDPFTGGGNPYSGFYDSDGIERIDAWGINGRGFWDLGAVVITLLYDYEWYDRVVEDEGDANPQRIFPAVRSDSAWQTTEELRIEGEGERYKWTTGFFFLYEELEAVNSLSIQQWYVINERLNQTLTSWAPYASGEIELVEEGVIPGIYQLTLGGGVRYNNEKKELSLVSSAIGVSSDIAVVLLPVEPVERTWKEWTGDVQLSYTPFSNEYGTLLSYLKYGHGFKSGHFNAGLTILGGEVRQDYDPVEPEFVDALEFGIRSRWFDDRLVFNAALFRYWYQDLQVFDITNEAGKLPIQKLLNGDADVLGAEVELRLKPDALVEDYIGPWALLFPDLISANLGWLDSEFGSFVVTKTVGQPRGSPTPHDFDYRGNALVAAPEWNFAAIAEWEFPLFGWGSLVPQYDLNWRSKVYLDPQMIDPISQDAYWVHNARIAYRTPDDRIELAFWVSNLFEEEYKVDVFDITRDGNTILEVWKEPRTYGVTLSLNW